MPKTANEPVVRAALLAVERGLIEIRNHSFLANNHPRYINSIAESIHAVPGILFQEFSGGEEQRLEIIRSHLGCLDPLRFPDAPSLLDIFNTELARRKGSGAGP